MMKLSCRFGWHNWGKWSEIFVEWKLSIEGRKYFNEVRALKCKDCGVIKKKEVRKYLTGDTDSLDYPTWENEQ